MRKTDVKKSPKTGLGVRDSQLLQELETTFEDDPGRAAFRPPPKPAPTRRDLLAEKANPEP